MTKNIKYVYDAEIGELVSSQQLNKKNTLTKKKTKKHPKPTFNVLDELYKIEGNFDKGFIQQNIRFLKIKLLKMARDNIIEKVELDKLDGLALSVLIVYRSLVDDNHINLELIKQLKEFITKLSNYSHLILQKMLLDKIIGYIDMYFF